MNRFLRTFLLTLATLVGGYFCLTLPTLAASQINNQINYQARLMDASGFPVADGNYSIIFSLYDAASAGTRLWTAKGSVAVPTALSVNVQNGLFTVLLGDTSAGGGTQNTLDTVDWNSDQIFLGVTISADAEMSPRKRFASAPQAFNSRQLQGMYASSTASGGQTLFTINQTQANAATGTRSSLDVRTNGTSNANDFLIRGLDGSGTTVFSVNRQGIASSTQSIANIGTFATATVAGLGICLSDGSFCSTGSSAEADTLQSVTNRGSFTTTTITAANLLSTGITSSTRYFANDGSFSSPAYSFNSSQNSGMFISGTDLAFARAGTSMIFATASGVFINFGLFPIAPTLEDVGNSSLPWRSAYFSDTVTSTAIYAATGTFAGALTVTGQSVCLANGTNCPSTTSTETLFTVTNRGSIATSTLTLFGGFIAASSSVTGTLNVAGALHVTGTANVALQASSTPFAITIPAALSGGQSLGFTLSPSSSSNGITMGKLNFTDDYSLFSFSNNISSPLSASGTGLYFDHTKNEFVAQVFGAGGISNFKTTFRMADLDSAQATSKTAFEIRNESANSSTRVLMLESGPSLDIIQHVGSGSPEGVIYDETGSIYFDAMGSASGTQAYLKTGTGFNNVGWKGIATVDMLGTGGSSSDSNWVFDLTGDFVRNATTTTDVVIGASTEATAPFVFVNNTTSSRLILGQSTSTGVRADLVIGATTSSGMNSLFQLTGQDLFVAGNIGSASSVYTNGAFIAGPGSTYYGNGYINKNDGNLTINASGGFITPSTDLGVSLGSDSFRYNGNFGGVTSTFLTYSTSTAGYIGARDIASSIFTAPGNVASFVSVATTTGSVNRLFVSGRYMYAAQAAFDILDIIDISDPLYPKKRGTISTGGGNIGGVYVAGKYLYTARQSADQLRIYDIGNPSTPALVGTLNGVACEDCTVSGRYLYSIDGDSFDIVDVSNPTNPTLVSTVATSTGDHIRVQGTLAFITLGGSNKTDIYDISNPRNPQVLAQITGSSALGEAVSGRYLYINSSTNLNIYDISNPSSPVLYATLAVNGGLDMAITDNILYIASGSTLKTVDVTSSTNPLVLLSTTVSASSVVVAGRYGYVGGNNGVTILDMGGADLPNARIGSLEAGNIVSYMDADIGGTLNVRSGLNVGQFGIYSLGALAVSATNTTSTFAGPLSVFGESAFIGNVGFGTTTAPITQLSVPGKIPTSTIGTLALGGGASPSSVFVQGRLAYVVNKGTDVLQIVDISNPSIPLSVGTVSTGLDPSSVYVEGRYAYVANTNADTFQVFDVSNPASPVSVSTVNTGQNPVSVFVHGKYAFVVNNGVNNFQIFDISNPTAVAAVGSGNTGVGPNAIFVQGRYAYVVNSGSDTIQIFDISNPSTPVNVGSTNAGGNPLAVYVQGRYAYVAASGSSTLEIIDVSNVGAPVSAGSIATGAGTDAVYVQDRVAYVLASSDAALQRFDVSNPTAPVNIGSVSTGATPSWVYVQGRFAVVVNFTADNLQIFDVGGGYIQQLEAGGMETGTLAVRNSLQAGEGSFLGGLTVGQTSVLSGGLSVAATGTSSTAVFINRAATAEGHAWGAYIDQLTVGSNINSTGTANYSMVITYASSATFGGLCLDDTSAAGTCPTNVGASIMADGAVISNAFDLAETYAVTGPSEAGDVLVLDASSTATVMRSSGVPYDSKVIGIVSTDPGFVLGWASGARVALTGRVPVKVSMNNGPINVGDALVSSDVAGYAMKATQPGMVLGYALESASTTGTAQVFVSVGFWAGLAFGPDGSIQIDNSGNVSIMNDLHVGGKLFPSLKGGGIQNDWYLFVDNTNPTTTYISTNADGFQSLDTYDFAERYYSPDELEAGDLVIVSDTGQTHVQRSMNADQMLLGIVSTRPAFIAGRPATSTYPIALSGRVPTKVSTMNGAIKAGDPIGPTTIPGVAAKAIHTGPTVGLALEDYDGSGISKIEVFVNPGWWTNVAETNQQTIINQTNTTVVNQQVATTTDVTRRGVGMIASGSKRVHINFASIGAYPFVQVTPRGLIQGNWGTDAYTDMGFDIVLSQEQTFDTYFSWQVEPLQGSDRLNSSDGTSADLDPVTGMPFGFVTPTTTEPVVEVPVASTSTFVSALTDSIETTSTTEPVATTDMSSTTLP